jgi:ubiquinone/menaquinone biosynthesis C-methylase UbiE
MVRVDRADQEMVKDAYQDKHHVDYHKRQFSELYRSTAHLIDFVREHLGSSLGDPYTALDVGCGGGANIYHLSKHMPRTEWVGVDWADQFFDLGQDYLKGANVDFRLVKGDFFELTKDFGEKSFDIAFSIQTLSWLPTYEDALRELLQVARCWVFVTSLFTDYHVDVISKVHLYTTPTWNPPVPYFYNIYSYPRFEDICRRHGAAAIYVRDFIIDIDIPESTTGTMGTFTRRLESGERLQFSGPLHMPWKLIAIKMSR